MNNKAINEFGFNAYLVDSAYLEDKGLFRSANILQIADVVHRVVFLLCFQTIVRLETSKMFRRLFGHFSFHNQNNSTSSPGLLG